MSTKQWATAPDHTQTGWPKGVPYIIGNEGCERFSFYGMKSILQVHLTSLFVLTAASDKIAQTHAQEMVHLFIAGVYAFPMIGALIADRLWGKYNTIIWLSLVYCAGHAVLAVGEDSLMGMYIGLGLIAIGSGGIKPCVSANVGDQFGKGNWHLVTKVFQAFYFIINFGSFFATLMIPWLKANYGTSVAFGIPGILMFIATIWFWMGRNKFVHVPAKPGGKLGIYDAVSSSALFLGFIGLPLFFTSILGTGALLGAMALSIGIGLAVFSARQKIEQDDGFLAVTIYSVQQWMSGGNKQAAAVAAEAGDEFDLGKHWFFAGAVKKFGQEVAEGPMAVIRIITVFFLVSVFWALFDQHSSSWIRQAQQMDLHVDLPVVGEMDLLASQIPALNPLMVMLLIPFNNFQFYPLVEKLGLKLTPLRKMSIGMLVAAVAFAMVAIIQGWIEAGEATGEKVTVMWQIIPYFVMTQAEVMVSITGLEFAYTQAPKRMKSTLMGFWLLTVAFGSKIVIVITAFEREAGLGLQQFFWVFAALMALAAVGFAARAYFYVGKDYSQ